MFQSKEQYKISEKELPDKEFKVIVIKMLTELGRRMDEPSQNFNKEIENIRKYQTEVIMELENTLRGTTTDWNQ